MPTIVTLGAASAKAFGFGKGAGVCPADGTKAIFALGAFYSFSCGQKNQSPYIDKFTYSTCASVSVTGFGTCYGYGAAVGNSSRGMFALGTNITTGTRATRKFTYSSCSVSTTGCLSANLSGGAGAGTSTVGILALGRGTTTTNKITYSTCSIASAGTLSSAVGGGSAAGNSTRGIFATGGGGSSYQTQFSSGRQKYTYSTCSVTSCGIGTSSFQGTLGAAAGNSTIGMFAIGYIYCGCGGGAVPSSYLNKYTYSSDTSTGTGFCTGVSMGAASAAGNSTRAIFAAGQSAGAPYGATTTRRKFTYATSSSTVSAAAASQFSKAGGATSWVTGINCGA